MTAAELKKEIIKMHLTLKVVVRTNLRTYSVRTEYNGSLRSIHRLIEVAQAAFDKHEKIVSIDTSIA